MRLLITSKLGAAQVLNAHSSKQEVVNNDAIVTKISSFFIVDFFKILGYYFSNAKVRKTLALFDTAKMNYSTRIRLNLIFILKKAPSKSFKNNL
jgi:hypothetical protein